MEIFRNLANIKSNLTDKFLAEYSLDMILGRGGMGIVVKGLQLSLSRPVAIKFLHSGCLSDSSSLARFRREARFLCKLNHPHIVTILDYGKSGEIPYLVSEFLDGKTLDLHIGKGQYLFWRDAVSIALEIADALRYAHSQGIIHRDLKPSNVFITRSDDVKIIDFGLAFADGAGTVITETGSILGTPLYMAPEQILNPKVGVESDRYALGALLYRMICGFAPFSKHTNDLAGLLTIKVAEDVPPLDQVFDGRLPPDLVSLVSRLLEREPGKRPGSDASICKKLARIAGVSGTIETISVKALEKQSGKKLRFPLVLGILSIVLAAVALPALWRSRVPGTTTALKITKLSVTELGPTWFEIEAASSKPGRISMKVRSADSMELLAQVGRGSMKTGWKFRMPGLPSHRKLLVSLDIQSTRASKISTTFETVTTRQELSGLFHLLSREEQAALHGKQVYIGKNPFKFADRLFVSVGDGKIRSYDLSTGTVRMKQLFDARTQSSICHDDSRIFVLSLTGEVYAFSLSGQELWKDKLPNECGEFFMACRGRLYIRMVNDALLCFRAATGRRLWRSDDIFLSNPWIATERYILAHRNYAGSPFLDARTGKRLTDSKLLKDGVDISSVLYNDNEFYVGTVLRKIVIGLPKEKPRLRISTKGTILVMSVRDDLVAAFCKDSQSMEVFNRNSGRPLWKYTFEETTGRRWLLLTEHYLLFLNQTLGIYCFGKKSGRRLWDVPGPFHNGFGMIRHNKGLLVCRRGRIYFLSLDE